MHSIAEMLFAIMDRIRLIDRLCDKAYDLMIYMETTIEHDPEDDQC